ncbi:MAG: hypothetical protein HZC38_04240 [Chloroflexi bacterium]|nr:hypothetical protein [Chloroflexota bacterium]
MSPSIHEVLRYALTRRRRNLQRNFNHQSLGSPKAVRENLDVPIPILPHAPELLRGDATVGKEHRSV